MRIEDFEEGGLIDAASVVRTAPTAWDRLEEGLMLAMSRHLTARPDITTTEWAVAERIIPADGHQPHPGPYDVANSPMMRAVQDSIDDPRTRILVMRIAAQVGKSAAATNIIGKRIRHDPCGITLMYPDEETAEKKIKEDFTPMFAATPSLNALVYEDEKQKHGKSTLKRFTFLGGHILPVTARSPSKAASSPAGLVVCDEYAKFVNTGEGDPGMAAVVRGQRYPNFRAVFLSTPVGDAKTCKITQAYEKSDRSIGGINCPGCGEWHQLDFEKVVIPHRDGEFQFAEVYHVHDCPDGTQYKLYDAKRFEMLDKGTWRSSRPFSCCGRMHDPFDMHVGNAKGPRVETWEVGGTGEGIPHCPDCNRSSPHARTRGFTCSTLYAKVGLEDVARWFIDAKDDPASLMQFNNQFLAKSFKVGGGESKIDLNNRRIDYWSRWGEGVDVPPDVIMLIMCCDVQHDRVECEIIGLAPGHVTYGIAFKRIMGSTFLRSTWDMVEDFRQKEWNGYDPDSGELRVYRSVLTAVDVGDSATLAHDYALEHAQSGVYPIRGGSERFRDMITPNKKGKLFYWISKKHTLAIWERRLQLGPDDQGRIRPGQVVYPTDVENMQGEQLKHTGYDDKYFEQAQNFHRVQKRNKRTFLKYDVYEPKDKSVAEEAVDIRSYSIGMEKIAMDHFHVARIEDLPRGWRLASELPRVPVPLTKPEADPVEEILDPAVIQAMEELQAENPMVRRKRIRPVKEPAAVSDVARKPRPGVSSGINRRPAILDGRRNPRVRGE